MYDLTTSTLQDILHGQKFTIKFITVHTNPPRKPPKSGWTAKSGLVACDMQNLMDIMVGAVSELSDGPKSSNLGF